VASGAKDDIMVIALDLLVLNSSVVWREQYDWSVNKGLLELEFQCYCCSSSFSAFPSFCFDFITWLLTKHFNRVKAPLIH
jgi:hypothetical protein